MKYSGEYISWVLIASKVKERQCRHRYIKRLSIDLQEIQSLFFSVLQA